MESKIADFGEGVINATTGNPEVLLIVNPSRSAEIKNVTLVNTDTQNRTCNIYINRRGIRRRISPKDLTLRPGYVVVLNDGYTLQASDTIEADVSSAGVVEWTINGYEQ